MTPEAVLDFSLVGALVTLSGALVLALYRLVRGPSLPDRVAALDLLAILAAGVIGVEAIRSGQRAFLDVAIALALVVFLGTVAFARYLEKRGKG